VSEATTFWTRFGNIAVLNREAVISGLDKYNPTGSLPRLQMQINVGLMGPVD
jgi:hypothetical protein